MSSTSAGYLRQIAQNARGVPDGALRDTLNLLCADLEQAAAVIDAYAGEAGAARQLVAALRGREKLWERRCALLHEKAAAWKDRCRKSQRRAGGEWERRYADLAAQNSELQREVARLEKARQANVTVIFSLSRRVPPSLEAALAAEN